MVEEPESFYSRGAGQFAKEFSRENMPDEYFELLDRFIELVDDGKILDAGCGHGRDVEYFIENRKEAIGVDKAEGMVQYAREHKKGEYHIADITNLDFKDGEFAGVWCNTVTQFFEPEEVESAVSELVRVIKYNGVLYITFKIGEGTIVREDYGSEVEQHLISEQKAREIIDSNGLEILETDKSNVKNLEILHLFCRKVSR